MASSVSRWEIPAVIREIRSKDSVLESMIVLIISYERGSQIIWSLWKWLSSKDQTAICSGALPLTVTVITTKPLYQMLCSHLSGTKPALVCNVCFFFWSHSAWLYDCMASFTWLCSLNSSLGSDHFLHLYMFVLNQRFTLIMALCFCVMAYAVYIIDRHVAFFIHLPDAHHMTVDLRLRWEIFFSSVPYTCF